MLMSRHLYKLGIVANKTFMECKAPDKQQNNIKSLQQQHHWHRNALSTMACDI